MKKRMSIILSVILVLVLISACAADSADWAANDSAQVGRFVATETAASAPMATPMPDMNDDADWPTFEEEVAMVDGMAYNASIGGAGVVPTSAEPSEPSGLAEKIIYSVDASIETVDFDETMQNVHKLIAGHGAFIESSSVSGINNEAQHFGWRTTRNAYFMLRVPVEHLDAVTDSLSVLGNVVHQNTNATNITMQFHDTQSRLNSLRIQEERLLDMLSRAEDVPDLIAIEERLGEVRMQVESFQTTINLWQNQVSYSTLYLNIWEVEVLTPTEQPSYWTQIGDGFVRTLRNVGRFFMNLFMWFVVNIPVLVILAVVLAVGVILGKKFLKKREKKAKVEVDVDVEVEED